MGLQDTQALQDAIFLSDGDLTPGVESVTYRKITGATRTINAAVRRYMPQHGERVAVKLVIGVPNDSTYGITAAEVNPGGDQVLVAIRPGDTAEYLTVHLLVNEEGQEHLDQARLWLELR